MTFFLIYIFNNIIFLKTWSWVSGKREEPRILPPVNSHLGERHSTKPPKFKPLRAVGINPRLRGIKQEAGTSRTWGENGGKCPGERWVRTFLRGPGSIQAST